jgi:hypothetical protein
VARASPFAFVVAAAESGSGLVVSEEIEGEGGGEAEEWLLRV